MTRARILALWEMHFVVFRGLSSSKLLVRYMLVFSHCNIYSPIFTPRVTCFVQFAHKKNVLLIIRNIRNWQQKSSYSSVLHNSAFHISLQHPRISLSFSFRFKHCLRALIPRFQHGFTGTLELCCRVIMILNSHSASLHSLTKHGYKITVRTSGMLRVYLD